MRTEEKYMGVLQNIEAAVLQAWQRHPELTDHGVQRVYEAAFQIYRAESRGHPPKPPSFTGTDLAVFELVHDICEWRLGRRAMGAETADAAPRPLQAAEMVECLQRLRKSVERWNRTGGSRGYLEFVRQFVA